MDRPTPLEQLAHDLLDLLIVLSIIAVISFVVFAMGAGAWMLYRAVVRKPGEHEDV